MAVNENRRKKHRLLEEIYKAGQDRGMTPRDICRAANIHPNYSTQMQNPSIGTLDKLAKAVGAEIVFVRGELKGK